MAAPKKTTWSLDPHTRAKHEILRRYLEAWTPILSLGGFRTIAYVDGFAGPGVYAGGEDGSPMIALKAALRHKGKITSKVLFLFIDKNEDRASTLREIVDGLALPSNFRVRVVTGLSFEEGFRAHLLDFYKGKGRALPPTFAFIDPFGWTGVPFDLVKEILANPSCEVLINFMYEEINRFIEHPEQGRNFERLLGTDEYRQINTLVEKNDRRRFLHDLYVRQLRVSAGAKYVRSFEMRNEKDVTDYFLFFATNSCDGIKKMKAAMWKVDESGEFRFSDATNPAQTLLFSPTPDFTRLREMILKRFAGTETTVGEVEDFVLADTPYRDAHYKKQVLGPLENEETIIVLNPPAGRRAGTYGDAMMRLRFAPFPT